MRSSILYFNIMKCKYFLRNIFSEWTKAILNFSKKYITQLVATETGSKRKVVKLLCALDKNMLLVFNKICIGVLFETILISDLTIKQLQRYSASLRRSRNYLQLYCNSSSCVIQRSKHLLLNIRHRKKKIGLRTNLHTPSHQDNHEKEIYKNSPINFNQCILTEDTNINTRVHVSI